MTPSPPVLFNGLQEAGVAEGVAALGDVGFTDQVEADGTDVVHVSVLQTT